jgi:hypothetical protein
VAPDALPVAFFTLPFRCSAIKNSSDIDFEFLTGQPVEYSDQHKL